MVLSLSSIFYGSVTVTMWGTYAMSQFSMPGNLLDSILSMGAFIYAMAITFSVSMVISSPLTRDRFNLQHYQETFWHIQLQSCIFQYGEYLV